MGRTTQDRGTRGGLLEVGAQRVEVKLHEDLRVQSTVAHKGSEERKFCLAPPSSQDEAPLTPYSPILAFLSVHLTKLKPRFRGKPLSTDGPGVSDSSRSWAQCQLSSTE